LNHFTVPVTRIKLSPPFHLDSRGRAPINKNRGSSIQQLSRFLDLQTKASYEDKSILKGSDRHVKNFFGPRACSAIPAVFRPRPPF